MKISFISGINYPEFALEGDILFTLCDWTKHIPYVDFYKDRNDYKITDNMAAENGISSPIEFVLEACRNLNTNEVWASDKLYDKNETIRLTTRFLRHMTNNDKKRFKVVGLPQGQNLVEWLECFHWMYNNPEIDVIGVSKYSVEAFSELAGTKDFAICRIKCIEFLAENNLTKKPVHCAGANHLIIHEIETYKKYPFVRSIDSNIAFKLGVHRIKIDDCTVEPKKRLDHNIKNLSKRQLDTIRYNIHKIKQALV